MINKGKGGEGGVLSRLGQLAKQAGPVGLFSGLGPRMYVFGAVLLSVSYEYAAES